MRLTLTEIYETRVASGDLRPDPAQHAVLHDLESLRLWLETNAERRVGLFAGLFAKPITPPKGLYLWGGVGRGKSMLMDLFTDATAISAKRRVHFHAFMQDIHKGMHAARKTGVEDPLAPVADAIIRDTRLLAFDEMQISDITDAMVVGRLFEKLFAGGVVIVTTSNRPPEDLYLNGLNRALFLPFIALIHDRLTVRALQSPTDYRQHRLQGAQVYFHPAGRVRGELNAIWSDLTGGAVGDALRLPVNGRFVDLPAVYSITGKSDLRARLSSGRIRHENAVQSDFSGLTGSLDWNWIPSGKLRFSTRITREPSQDAYFVLDSAGGARSLEFSRISTSLRLQADYAASERFRLRAFASGTHRELSQSLPLAGGSALVVNGTDRTMTGGLGITSQLSLGCEVGHELRRGQAPLSSDITSSTLGCQLQVSLGNRPLDLR